MSVLDYACLSCTLPNSSAELTRIIETIQSMKTMTGMIFMAELTFKQGVNAAKVCVKTSSIAYGVQAKAALESLLRN